jgi:uridine kinase
VSSLAEAAAAVAALPERATVAVDGLDGAGKTTFADALAERLERPAIRASADDFLHPRAIRYRLGRESPEGFYRDSVDVERLVGLLLEPFAAGEPFRRRAFDHRADVPVDAPAETAPADAVLVVDGLFLHRAELRSGWTFSILLDVAPEVAARRLLQRDGKPTRERYVRGQQLYFADAEPRRHASLVLPW